jgi:ubiquinone/menaquinone biosynthesis C-methylase UbiE
MSGAANHNDQILNQFSQQAEGYSRLTGSAPPEDRVAAFRALIGARADDQLLDVCCGPGTMSLGLAPYMASVTGLDLTPAMLDQARAAQVRRGVANAEWIEGDVFAMPFADASFSLVLCGAAFHHMPEPELALREMVRVCRSGGRIVVRDVTPAADKSAAYDRMEKLRDPSHTHALTPEELGGLGAGLPVGAPQLYPSLTADLPLHPILAASFPEACTTAEIHEMFREDAIAGNDALGFKARIVDGEILVSYAQTTAIWIKN